MAYALSNLLAATLVVFVLLAAPGCDSEPPPLEDGWVVSTPAAEGMNAAVLEGAREYAFQEGKNTQGVVVVRNGRIVAEWYARGRDARSYAGSWSVAKSFTSTLIGIAIAEGAIAGIDVPVADYLPSWQGTSKEAITIGHVLTMSSGLDWVEDYDLSSIGSSDVIALVITPSSPLAIVEEQPLAALPGTVFNYSSGDSMLLSAVLEGATGMSAAEYAEEKLFAPLGLEGVEWWRSVDDYTLTYCCLDMRSRDFARFGQLYLQGGVWEGRQVVPTSWVEDSITPSAAYEGYGLKWWLSGVTDAALPADTYSARGHDGQFIYVIPSLDLVVVRNGLYDKSNLEPVAVPRLFDLYPSDGIGVALGTYAPDSWRDAEFLTPIIDSINAP